MTDDISPKDLDPIPQEITKENLTNSDLNQMEITNMSALPITAVTALEGFLCDFIAAIVKAEADGKITIADTPLFVSPLLELPGLLPQISQVPAQLADIDPVEAGTIKQTMIDKLGGVVSPQVEAVAEAGLQVVLDLNALYIAYKALKTPAA